MPDTKLTWANLREHLRRCGVIYIVAIAAALIAANLLWTVTTPRIPEDQRILIYLADAWTDPEPLNALAGDLLTQAQAYDPSLREIAFESLPFADTGSDYTGAMVLMTRLATGEGDLFLAGPDAMAELVSVGGCMDLTECRAAGWLEDLEPFYADFTDPETGEITTLMAGLKLDSLDALFDMRAFNNETGCLALPANGAKTDAAMKVAELLVDMLEKEGDAHA